MKFCENTNKIVLFEVMYLVKGLEFEEFNSPEFGGIKLLN